VPDAKPKPCLVHKLPAKFEAGSTQTAQDRLDSFLRAALPVLWEEAFLVITELLSQGSKVIKHGRRRWSSDASEDNSIAQLVRSPLGVSVTKAFVLSRMSLSSAELVGPCSAFVELGTSACRHSLLAITCSSESMSA
jgi:hypothetical protein